MRSIKGAFLHFCTERLDDRAVVDNSISLSQIAYMGGCYIGRRAREHSAESCICVKIEAVTATVIIFGQLQEEPPGKNTKNVSTGEATKLV